MKKGKHGTALLLITLSMFSICTILYSLDWTVDDYNWFFNSWKILPFAIPMSILGGILYTVFNWDNLT